MDHPREIERVIAWAEPEENIRAVILTGSAARGPEHVDELSDLDIELYVSSPAALLDDDSWHTQFGDVLVVESLANPGWHPTRLLYCVGKKFDFLVAPTSAIGTTKHSGPIRVLVDKDGLTEGLVADEPDGAGAPEPTSFLEVVNWFYAAAIMCAKAVARDEPWVAKVRAWDAKQRLLTMIEWDHGARYGWSYAERDGKRVRRWMDDDVFERLDGCWGGFPVAETAQELLAAMELFDRVSIRAAAALELPGFDSGPVRDEIQEILGRHA